MEKKISVKNMFLLLVISVGLIGLGIGSTFAVFTANAEINNPIVLNSNLSYDGGVLNTVEVTVPAGGINSVTLNISNTSGTSLNYIVWYLNEDSSIRTATNSGSPQDSLANGASTTVNIDIRNAGKKETIVLVGISSGSQIVLDKSMTPVSSTPFIMANSVSYDSTNTGVDCNDVSCMLDSLYEEVTLKVGDYVSYTPSVTSYPTDTKYTGYSSSQTIYPSELNLWRVLNIYEDGRVDLISEYVSSTDVYFKGLKGYQNLVGYLNVLASKYETEGITSGSRHFGYDGQTEFITDTSMFTSTPPFGCSTDGKAGNCSNTTYPKDPDDYEAYGGGDKLYTTDYDRVNTVLGTRIAYKVGTNTATAYWMASRYYNFSSSSDYNWNGRRVVNSGSGIYYNIYYYYNGRFGENSINYALRPIVTLKSGLYFGGKGTKDNPREIITS